MPRRVRYDAASRAAAAAAGLLGDEFDVAPLPASTDASALVPAVLLLGADAPAGRWDDRRLRVVALVEGEEPGPWPGYWYALLPAGVSAPILARAVRNAFADIDHVAALTQLEHELFELNEIGIRLSAERNRDALLDTILTRAREITRSDAGSLYLVDETADGTRSLVFVLAQNDSVKIPFRESHLPLTSESVAGHVALSGEILNLADAYHPPPGVPFHINRSFDEQARYRTKSMLVVPMRTPQGETIGVLQLINCKPDFGRPFASVEETERTVQRYSQRHQQLAGSLASQAAVAIHNSHLVESIRRLFEGFVQASVVAIESRDPTTSGHSFRVADLTVGLAQVVDRCRTGPYGDRRFSAEEMTELRYAALLHDFGKVGVREQVLVKAKKLLPGELERIGQRVELIKRGVELRYAGKKIEHLLDKGRRRFTEQTAALDAELAAYLAELDESLRRITAANEPAVLPRDIAEQIERLARRTFEDHRGKRRRVITPDEAAILSIRRGSLTAAEFKEIQSHVVHTYTFLSKIPWTKELRAVPEIARSHHEKLDGTGYPHQRKGDEIPLQSRMMTIADIYDALTAGDRPYKRGVSRDEALDILGDERRAGHVDGALLDLFVDAKLWELMPAWTVSPRPAEKRHPRR